MSKYSERSGIKDSFSKNHTFPYSNICVQEMNLAYHYGKIFWNTSCLTVNAGADENNQNNKNTQYGKIAKAIGEIQGRGQIVALPHINKTSFGFKPDLDNNEIIFGLKGIANIGNDIAHSLIEGQPYVSFDDFIKRKMTKPKKNKSKKTIEDKVEVDVDSEGRISAGKVITLIKAGCFDNLLNKPREEIMKDFLFKISEPKTKLSMSDIITMDNYNLLNPVDKSTILRYYRFRKYVYQKQFFVGIDPEHNVKDPRKFYYLEPKFAEPYFFANFAHLLKEDEHYYFDEEGRTIIKNDKFDSKAYEPLIKEFKEKVLTDKKIIDIINDRKFDELWEQKAKGNRSKWEMDSLCFYHGTHELAHVNREKYNLDIFEELPKKPVVSEYTKRGERYIPKFKIYKIIGTVLDRDKNKHTVTILTPTGVTTIKFYKGQYIFYDKQISHTFEGDSKKTVLENSWFKRGNKILLTGYRRGDRFVPKKYGDSIYRHTVQLIKEIDEEGNLKIQSERVDINEL